MAPTLDRHVVTAVLVAHDGARWLPETLKALLTQARPVQRLLTVDTGSRDRGPAVLAEVVGRPAVLTLPRTTGYGEAVAEALRQDAASAPVPGDAHGRPPGPGALTRESGAHGSGAHRSGAHTAAGHTAAGHGSGAHAAGVPQPDGQGDRTEWIWLLHDDCAPAPDALACLLRTADTDPGIAVLGPKVRDWDDRRVLRELGFTVDAAGRRETGLDRREFDQGQHDGVRDVLAVGSAGMLVRRDVWDRLGGFDVEYGIFRDDLDFCWRVHAAGHRVVTASDAVVYHAEAARRGLREIGMTAEHPARLDRRNALYTLLANQPLPAMWRALARNVWASLVHALHLVVTKRPAAAREEVRALADVLRDPGRLRRARAARAEGRTRVHRTVRRFQTRNVVLRRTAEAVSEYLAAHERDRVDGEEGPSGEPGPVRRFLARPGVVLVLALTAVAVAAERSLPTAAGRLGGGALVPAWGGASDLWAQYLSGWHPVGLGSDAGSPPYVGVLAVLSTITFGKPWLAVSILLLGSVPLAGLSAYYASRLLVARPPRPLRRAHARRRRVPLSVPASVSVPAVRAWFAAVYALLPAATGAIAGGRLGTAVVHVLLPLIAVHVARVYGFPRPRPAEGGTGVEGGPAPRGGGAEAEARARRKRAGRSAWTVALLLAVAMAFVPLTWLIGVAAAALVRVLFDRPGRSARRHLVIALGVPPLLTLPWTAGLLLHPSRFLTEAGLHRGFEPADAAGLLLLDPGGPGTPARWALAGLLAVAVAALALRGRRNVVLAGWLLAIFALLVAVVTSAATVTKGADAAPAWPGVALIFAGAGVLVAATAAVQRAVEALTGDHPVYQAGGAAVALAALTAPVLAAGCWVAGGAGGPLTKVNPDTVPQFVHGPRGVRTLVLNSEPTGRVTYTVLRDAPPRIGEAEVADGGRARDRLDDLVAGLVAGREGDAGPALTRMGIQYLLVPYPRTDAVTKALDEAPELTRLSRTGTFAVWRVPSQSARMMLLDGPAVTPLPSGRIDARAQIPPGNDRRTLLLAEPADGGWRATLDGRELKGRTVDGWAQGYEIPASGGEFRLSRSMTMRHTWLVVQGVALLVVVALALPGARADALAFTGERERRRRRRRGRRRATHARVRHEPPAPEPVEERSPEEVS